MGAHEEANQAMAVRLALVLKRLRAKLREQVATNASELSLSQLAILQQLFTQGPQTAAHLALQEQVSQQAIAQNVALLKAKGFVAIAADRADGRKNLITITAAGKTLRTSIIASKNAWLAKSIAQACTSQERAVLEEAIGILERLIHADI